MKIAYVILHYMADKDTIECANSILEVAKNSEHNVKIVIVDNGSKNDSLNMINQNYATNSSVVILHNEDNLGFARGNNIGYAYAKNILKADFIVQLNNDTLITMKDFNEVLVNKFNEKKYYVLGPDIETADGYHQNPGKKQTWNKWELIVYRLKKRIRLLLSYFNADKKIDKAINSVKNVYSHEILQGDVENTILHGACLIFSPFFIKKFDGMCNETFLYWEEDILKLQSDYYGFLMLYSSDLSVYHKEDVATNMETGSNKDKQRRKYKFLIESSKVYSRLKRKYKSKKKFLNRVERIAGNTKNNGGGWLIDFDTPKSYIYSLLLQRGIMLIRGKVKSIGINKKGKVIFCGKKVSLVCKKKIHIGSGVTFQDYVYIDALSLKGLNLGNNCSIGKGTIIRCSGNLQTLGIGFQMGNNSSLGDNCFVGATGGVHIGNDVIGGQNIRFHSSNHNFSDAKELIRKQGITAKGINIGNNCWIGAGVVFLDGVTIGDGCVIGANSVVTKSFPENCVIVGAPAKIVNKRI